MCYLIRSGLIKIRRNSDDFVIAFLPVPNLVGVTNLLPESSGLYLELQTESEIATITTAHAHELIANNNAWELLAGHIAKVSSNLLNHEIIMTAPTSYELLRFQLIGLMKEPVNVRKSTSAAKYILERTRLSRSTVMKMLAQLKQGGYIELVDGMLLAVHQLPSKY
ncbi:helix-turn-helix domain-containing protein [Buttiauxella agrestis]|nr:helix-turn-helix domain-containing protein [Buttiauxella agrestis]